MGTCFVQGSVFHVIRVCTKCCQLPPLQAAQYLQRNQASKPEATSRLCLSLPQEEVLCITARTSLLHVHSPLQLPLILHVFTRHLLGKSLWETQLYIIERARNTAMKTVAFFIFLAASFIFIFNVAKSFYRNRSISGKEQRRVRLKCSPSRCMLPSQMLFPFFPIPFSFDIAGRLFS